MTMKIAVFYILNTLLLVSMSASSPCTQYVTRTFTAYRATTTRHAYRCGLFKWRRCFRDVSGSIMYTRRTEIQVCCSGYGPFSQGCHPICTGGCGVNKECTAAESCTCVQGWTGQDCLTDVNECLERTDLCEAHQYCNNTNGSYVCHCPPDKMIATDGYRCLDGVQDISGLGFSTHSIGFTWSAPVNHTDDGAFGNYSINCTSGYTSVLTSTATVVTGLQPFTNYTCCITPHWATNGVGPETCATTTTQQDAPASPPVNVRVENASSYSVLVQWLPPEVPNGIITHYVIYINYTNGTHHKRQVGGDTSLYLLEELRPHQMVGIRISASTIAGEGPLSVEKNTRTKEAVPSPVSDLNVTVTSHTSATITWSPPAALNGIIIKYHITLTKQTSRHTTVVEWILNPDQVFNHRLTILEPYTPYKIEVSAATSVGKGEISPITFFTVEGVPAVSPTLKKITRLTATSVTVQWEPLTLEESRGFITNYYVKLSSEQDCSLQDPQRWNLSYNATTAQNTLTMSWLDPQQLYCVAVAALTKAGMGNFSIFIVTPDISTQTSIATPTPVATPTPAVELTTTLPVMLVVGAGGGGLAFLLVIAIAIGVILCLMLKKAYKIRNKENAVVSSASNPMYINNEKDSKEAEEEEAEEEEEANVYELCQGSNTFEEYSDLTSDGIYESVDDCVKNPET